MPLLVCPNCEVGMVVVQRSGVELDTCPRCRGVWLDRGELDKLLQPIREEMGSRVREQPTEPHRNMSSNPHGGHYPSPPPYAEHRDHGSSKRSDHSYDRDGHKRRKNPLESLFDIFD